MSLTNQNHSSLTAQQQIQSELMCLKTDLQLDFVAVALADESYRDIYWKFGLGAKTERYRKIMVRIGKGMAGKVLKAKSPHIVTHFPEEVRDEMLEYPIFIVESLRSGVGVSVDSSLPQKKLSYGVLLVGQRVERVFSPSDIERVEQSAAVLAKIYDHYSVTFPSASKSEELDLSDVTGPLLQRLRKLHKEGLACEILDQRVTHLSTKRQEEIAEVIELIVQGFSPSLKNAAMTIEQDQIGHTVVVFEGQREVSLAPEILYSIKKLLKSLKSDLEISVEPHHQSVRFILPTRQLIDEDNWRL